MVDVPMIEVWIAALVAVLSFGGGAVYGYFVKDLLIKDVERKKKLIHEAIDEYLARKEVKKGND